MNVEIGAEAALFPEKEYISRIFVAVHAPLENHRTFFPSPFPYLLIGLRSEILREQKTKGW